jgi:hypothetical protein
MASIIERIGSDCPVNLMLAIIALTAPFFRLDLLPMFVELYQG